MTVGRNPTSLATSKGEPDGPQSRPLTPQILVVSRAARKVSWVRFAGNSGSVIRTLTDTRLVDPIAVDDVDNFANAGYLISVVDYAGKAVRNYRYGPVIFSDRLRRAARGPTAAPSADTAGWLEYAGAFAMPGKPFLITTTNVP